MLMGIEFMSSSESVDCESVDCDRPHATSIEPLVSAGAGHNICSTPAAGRPTSSRVSMKYQF
jgi:hypothetical protein